MNRLIRYLTDDGSAVCSVLDGTEMCAELERIHKTSAVCTAALGRLAMGASLMGYGLKSPEDCLTLRISGGGPAGNLVACSDGLGNTRAYMDNPNVELPLNARGKLDVGGCCGREGTLLVIKDLGLKEPYTGQTALVSGEIAEDITQYFAQSEQTPTACGLGVLVAPDLTVKHAGGFLIHLMPFAAEETAAVLEKNLAGIPPVTQMLEDGLTPDDIARKLLAGLDAQPLDEANPELRCVCSRERTADILRALDERSLREMAEEMPEIEVICHFCGKKYVFAPEEIAKMADEKRTT